MEGQDNTGQLQCRSDRKIFFGLQEGCVEEAAGKRKFYLTMNENNIFEYEKRMLCDSGCPYTLSMKFLVEEEIMKAYYDFTGYVQLKEYLNRKTHDDFLNDEINAPICDVLNILSKILNCIRGMENYLFSPERFSVNLDVVFINPDSNEIVFAFLPIVNVEESLQCRLIKMINELNGLYQNDELALCLEKFGNTIQTKNPGLEGMIAILGSMQREISYIYNNSKNFRKIEEKEAQQEDKRPEWNRKEADYEEGSIKSARSFFTKANTEIPIRAKVNNPRSVKLIVMQVILILCLIAVFLIGKLENADFVCLTIIAVGIDLLFMRKFQLI